MLANVVGCPGAYWGCLHFCSCAPDCTGQCRRLPSILRRMGLYWVAEHTCWQPCAARDHRFSQVLVALVQQYAVQVLVAHHSPLYRSTGAVASNTAWCMTAEMQAPQYGVWPCALEHRLPPPPPLRKHRLVQSPLPGETVNFGALCGACARGGGGGVVPVRSSSVEQRCWQPQYAMCTGTCAPRYSAVR